MMVAAARTPGIQNFRTIGKDTHSLVCPALFGKVMFSQTCRSPGSQAAADWHRTCIWTVLVLATMYLLVDSAGMKASFDPRYGYCFKL